MQAARGNSENLRDAWLVVYAARHELHHICSLDMHDAPPGKLFAVTFLASADSLGCDYLP